MLGRWYGGRRYGYGEVVSGPHDLRSAMTSRRFFSYRSGGGRNHEATIKGVSGRFEPGE